MKIENIDKNTEYKCFECKDIFEFLEPKLGALWGTCNKCKMITGFKVQSDEAEG